MKIAIIGGSGKMGQWFASFLLKDGKEVVITGRDQVKLLKAGQQLGAEVADNINAVKSSDIVVLSVPVDSITGIVKEISSYIRPEQVIVDITSVKALPLSIMHNHLKKGLILGVHPMFGPGANDVRNQNFVLTPTNEKEKALAGKAKDYLEAKGARAFLMTPQEHDEMMAIILGLSHFIAIASADTLLSFDKFKERKAISGVTYRVLITLAESVISEDPELYALLQMNLPEIAQVEAKFQETTRIWADLVKNKNRQKFVDRMKRLKDKFEEEDPDFGKSYLNLYKFLSGL